MKEKHVMNSIVKYYNKYDKSITGVQKVALLGLFSMTKYPIKPNLDELSFVEAVEWIHRLKDLPRDI